VNINELANYRILIQAQCKRPLQSSLVSLMNSIAVNWTIRDTEYSYESNNIKVSFTIRLPIEFAVVAKLVCDDLKVSTDIVVGNCHIKNRRIVLARDIIMYILRYRYGYTLSTIIRLMKMRCNGSVIFACKKINSKNLPEARTCALQHFYHCVKQNHPNFTKLYNLKGKK